MGVYSGSGSEGAPQAQQQAPSTSGQTPGKGQGHNTPALPWLGQMPLAWQYLFNPERTLIPQQPVVPITQLPAPNLGIPPGPYTPPYTPGQSSGRGGRDDDDGNGGQSDTSFNSFYEWYQDRYDGYGSGEDAERESYNDARYQYDTQGSRYQRYLDRDDD